MNSNSNSNNFLQTILVHLQVLQHFIYKMVVQTPDILSNLLSHSNKYNTLKLITLKLIKIDKVVSWEVNTSYSIWKTKMELTACKKLLILSSLFLYGGISHRNPCSVGSKNHIKTNEATVMWFENYNWNKGISFIAISAMVITPIMKFKLTSHCLGT